MNWKLFWQNYRIIDITNENDLKYQVGKTIEGKVITDEQFDADVQEIIDHFELCNNDVLLDLCCGNGIVTKKLSEKVNKVIGIDFSEVFISNAKIHSSSKNIHYFLIDVLDKSQLENILENYNFTKILLNDCLAYFDPNSLKVVLQSLSRFNVDILLMSILDKNKKWKFYNTPKRKWIYLKERFLGKNKSGLGYWWNTVQIQRIAHQSGYACNIFYHNSTNHTAHYRFNAKLIKR